MAEDRPYKAKCLNGPCKGMYIEMNFEEFFEQYGRVWNVAKFDEAEWNAPIKAGKPIDEVCAHMYQYRMTKEGLRHVQAS